MGAVGGAAPGRAGPARGTPPSRWAVAGALAGASHPGPTVVVTVLSAALAVAVGGGARAWLAAAAVLAGQLSIGWSNDWLDAARDAAVGRRDKPVVRGLVGARDLRRAAVAALVLCGALSLLCGVAAGAVHLVAVASAWAYNARLKSTASSWLPYAVSFGLLPVFLVLAVTGATARAWLVAVGALLGVGAHLANVLPDLEDDAATGVRGLPHRLGRRTTSVLAPLVLAVAVVVATLAPPGPPTPAGAAAAVAATLLAAGAGVVAVTVPRSRAPFAVAMGVAVLCVVALVVGGGLGPAGRVGGRSEDGVMSGPSTFSASGVTAPGARDSTLARVEGSRAAVASEAVASAAVAPPRGPVPRTAFDREVTRAGWSAGSRWGYDAELECYWAELWPEGAAEPVVVGAGHLITTLPGLARALAHAGHLAEGDALLALTA
ncbi:UbiA family prenyltransferase [Cellulomonas carbonis]|uniref:Ubiquinone biosynthesis protein UbiA n=1 Tax=Cellulomonas carbonis T26 TaxID=947969 RepID=A0A0A0BX32_9CELL|nr:UbiA family prenyltransferase [Cellulomonas carbonis]KGM12535.1 ubiquinone biosynthesis protein UbiA [Cellulomonas carbonis T26]GGB93640.1 hypothetical protein GCM10010972_02900 [Cellulomonas carbonis]